MRIVLIVLAVLVGLIALMAIIGALLPRHHEASRSTTLRRSPLDVYAIVSDVEKAPTWRPDVQRIEMLGPDRYREHGPHGAVTYDIVSRIPGHEFTTRIADQNLGYSGSWTYTFAPTAEGTQLTITERGDVSNVLFRFLSRFVFGYTKSMEAYLEALGRFLR
ncbi:MAG: SRPBCC family protein [Acidobacteria bacterium]|nr:SRPBCC family protein [Acidobacteriota bacterium]